MEIEITIDISKDEIIFLRNFFIEREEVTFLVKPNQLKTLIEKGILTSCSHFPNAKLTLIGKFVVSKINIDNIIQEILD